MSIVKSQDKDVTVLKLDGDLLGLNAQELRTLAQECLEEGRRDFVIDLSDAHLCDSAGLESLTWLQRQCDERLALVKLSGLTDTLKKVFEITRLNHRFQDPYNGF